MRLDRHRLRDDQGISYEMTDHTMGEHVLDARPDRIDFRDRRYNPPLVSLPESHPSDEEIGQFLPDYHRTGKILDQGTEGACTGYGLAAVINYINWDRWMRKHWGVPKKDWAPKPDHVSPWMLYDNARVYDEWEGEDYSGSSCRGAMKGWHKHGVCEETLWSKRTTTNPRPDEAWQTDAERRPLGAYYRVDTRSIADMQAAIHEVRAVYCSARVHNGWLLRPRDHHTVTVAELPLPVISTKSFDDITGGHAFAIVGYTEYGFIVQNSWGEDWGYNGFALLTYEDWLRNGDDAWVAALAARANLSTPVGISSSYSKAPMNLAASFQGTVDSGRAKAIKPWSEGKAYEHAVVMGNDGKLLRRLIDTEDRFDNLKKVVLETSETAIKNGAKHVMVYAHGGLNSERAAIERAMRMGPWFEANDIHPIFVVWRTSLLESIGQIGLDQIQAFQKERDDLRSTGFGDVVDRMVARLQNKFDKAFEAAAEKVVGKAVWSQMKQNARTAAAGDGGSRRLAKALRSLKQQHPALKVHLVGHSAGSILLGHMLGDLDKTSGVDTVSLFAPACSMRFAAGHYGRALRAGTIGKGKMHVDNLSDDNERRDTVGPYGKSLLYLVSRAFEDAHKTALLGFARCWADPKQKKEDWLDSLAVDFAKGEPKFIRDWDVIVDEFGIRANVLEDREVATYKDGGDSEQIKAVHGSFDNALAIMNATLKRILGGARPKQEITDLRGF